MGEPFTRGPEGWLDATRETIGFLHRATPAEIGAAIDRASGKKPIKGIWDADSERDPDIFKLLVSQYAENPIFRKKELDSGGAAIREVFEHLEPERKEYYKEFIRSLVRSGYLHQNPITYEAKTRGKELASLQLVQKEGFGPLPEVLRGEIAKFASALPGSLKQQQAALKRKTAGRKRVKSRKTHRNRRLL